MDSVELTPAAARADLTTTLDPEFVVPSYTATGLTELYGAFRIQIQPAIKHGQGSCLEHTQESPPCSLSEVLSA